MRCPTRHIFSRTSNSKSSPTASLRASLEKAFKWLEGPERRYSIKFVPQNLLQIVCFGSVPIRNSCAFRRKADSYRPVFCAMNSTPGPPIAPGTIELAGGPKLSRSEARRLKEEEHLCKVVGRVSEARIEDDMNGAISVLQGSCRTANLANLGEVRAFQEEAAQARSLAEAWRCGIVWTVSYFSQKICTMIQFPILFVQSFL